MRQPSPRAANSRRLLERLESSKLPWKRPALPRPQNRTMPRALSPPLSKQQIEQSLGETLRQLAGSSFEFAGVLAADFPDSSSSSQSRHSIQGRFGHGPGLPYGLPPFLKSAGDESEGQFAGEDLHVTLDLFDPPVHIAHLQNCQAAKNLPSRDEPKGDCRPARH